MTKFKPKFIADPATVLDGEAAEAALETTNDGDWYDPDKGIVAVPLSRWRIAQQYEKDTWLKHNAAAVSDRNEDHRTAFNGYAALPSDLGNVIELGCGPFTNLRLIMPNRTAASVTLLDPLANEYLSHSGCQYKDKTLVGQPVKLVAKAIEDYSTKTLYDTIVMINVLTHCRDAEKVMHWIDQHLQPGGTLVFGEHPSEVSPYSLYDAGHPLRFTQAQLNEWLAPYETIFKNGGYAIVRKPNLS